MRRAIFFVLLIAVFSLNACSSLQTNESASASSAPSASEQSLGTYEEFEDVLIPREMKLNSKGSFVFETPQLKTGILVYEGKVDAVSLANFFESHMIQDNWKLRSKMKYVRTILVFEKADRDCIINILDETFNTKLEVMVAPRLNTQSDSTSSGTLSPLEDNLPQ